MRTTNFIEIFIFSAFVALFMIGCTSTQNAQTMSKNNSKSNKNVKVSSPQTDSGQPTSSSMNSKTNTSPNEGLANFPDKKINMLPKSTVSITYVVEHRSALNDKIITVSGFVVGVSQSPTVDSPSGVRSMANPQPRIFIADTSKESRDKNLDLMVIIREGDQNYSVNQKVTIKVKVSATKAAVVLRKIS